MAEPLPEAIKLSIILPVLNEARQLDDALDRLLSHPGLARNCEIIVCDGGSSDSTPEIARSHPCRVLQCERGRARQMNYGAANASGQSLLFLHADSRLPADLDASKILAAEWGFFRLQLSGTEVIYRLIEKAINWRTGLTRVAGGDQGLFFDRELFDRIGGYPDISLMEDVAISKLARRLKAPAIIEQPLTSSSRRWRQRGVLRTILLMWSLRLAFWLGVNPERLHRIYYPQRG